MIKKKQKQKEGQNPNYFSQADTRVQLTQA